tara:strand:+ start:66 stop:242 length:177 start_codon:yes stop_codon:yes gene_type:complete
MSEFTVGHLKELIQGLDNDISIEVLHGGANYNIDDGLLKFNQGAANETVVSLTLRKVI